MKPAKAGCLGFMAACILVVLLVAIIPDKKSVSEPRSASSGHTSDRIEFDPQEAVHKAQLDQLEAGAGVCMQRAVHGLLMQGERSRITLLAFAETSCGAPLKRFLMSLNVPEKAADEWVRKDAQDVLEVELQ